MDVLMFLYRDFQCFYIVMFQCFMKEFKEVWVWRLRHAAR